MNSKFNEILDSETFEKEDEIEVKCFSFNNSLDAERQKVEKKKNAILRMEKNFNKGVNLHENLENVDIKLIHDTPKGWNPFNPPTEIETLDLMRSIENVGLIYPIYVTKDKFGKYTLICGRCRLTAYANLFNITNSPRYQSIPCYILPAEEVDELFLRTLIVESNIGFRFISKFNLIQSLIINYDIMKKTKLYRNEKNIGMELAKTFNMSESSVFNFLRVKSLCDEVLDLLFEKKITLKAAIYLARVSKETQKNILERIGAEAVNVIFRLKLLTSRDYSSIEKLEERIKATQNIIPPKTKIIIEMQRELVNPLFKLLAKFKKDEASAFIYNTKFNYIFNIKYDGETMDYYVNEGMIDKNLLRKINAKTMTELMK